MDYDFFKKVKVSDFKYLTGSLWHIAMPSALGSEGHGIMVSNH